MGFTDAVTTILDARGIDYSYQEDKGVGVKKAVVKSEAEAKSSLSQSPLPNLQPKPELILPEVARFPTKVVSYLQKRGISPEVISRCLELGILFESRKYQNVVFVGKDEHGKARFACVRGISDDFKGDVAGSDKQYSFSLPIKNPKCPQLALIGIISSVLTIAGLSLSDFLEDVSWEGRLGIVLIVYILIIFSTLGIKIYTLSKGFRLTINGVTVEIRQGDIFKVYGRKVIPFNEYFDTQVDNVMINETSLNGQLVTAMREQGKLQELEKAIIRECSSPLKAIPTDSGKIKYQLGCIKRFEEYMLLAFSHFNEHNEARMTWIEYESCLRKMWVEICRAYADAPIYLPLLGSGVTRIDGLIQKSDFDLLKCMICTLRASNIQLTKPITIILTKTTMKNMNLYDLKAIV